MDFKTLTTKNTEGMMTTDNTDFTEKELNRNSTHTMSTFLYKDESFAIRGAIFEVYNQIGCGFLEGVYQECLSKEFKLREIPHISQPEIQLSYKGEVLMQTYRPDFVCYGKIILELKAINEFNNDHRAQLLNYLKASNMRLGLMVNFGNSPRAVIERFIL